MLCHSQDSAVKAFGKVCAGKRAVSNASPIDEPSRAHRGTGGFLAGQVYERIRGARELVIWG